MMPAMPAPVPEMLLEVGTHLAPFAVGCLVFALVTLGAMLVAMIAEMRGGRSLAVVGRFRPLPDPTHAAEVDQAA